MNVLTLAGRVVSEPSRRDTTKGVVCEFRLAVECRPRLWIVVQTWGQTAGRAAQHLTAGRTIAASGMLISESYITRSSETAVRWYLRASTISFLDRPAGLAYRPAKIADRPAEAAR
mgnify:CR=1 FL=1